MPRKHQRTEVHEPYEPDPAEFPATARTIRRLETPTERNQRIEAEFGRKRARNERRQDERVAKAINDWDVCCVRLGGLVKMGWSLKLRSRLKSYGASAEILCHYPATRADETLMHRQLRPYLAKGREWYHDCKLIHDVVAGIVERHGEPTILPVWTEPKADPIRPRRSP